MPKSALLAAVRESGNSSAGRKTGRSRHTGKDPEYLRFIRSQPCLICSRRGLIQLSETNAHHHGPRGLGQKVPDRHTLPLCHVEHHQYGKESVHVMGRRWAEYHGIDPQAEFDRLSREFDTLRRCAQS